MQMIPFIINRETDLSHNTAATGHDIRSTRANVAGREHSGGQSLQSRTSGWTNGDGDWKRRC
jgi:hypothetical protein